jgi:hypothetical protein
MPGSKGGRGPGCWTRVTGTSSEWHSPTSVGCGLEWCASTCRMSPLRATGSSAAGVAASDLHLSLFLVDHRRVAARVGVSAGHPPMVTRGAGHGTRWDGSSRTSAATKPSDDRLEWPAPVVSSTSNTSPGPKVRVSPVAVTSTVPDRPMTS